MRREVFVSVPFLFVLLLSSACDSSVSDGADGDSDADTDADGDTDIYGAWESPNVWGPQSEPPSCLVLCESGRAFTADHACDDLAASDFETYLELEGEAGALQLRCGETVTPASFTVGEDGEAVFAVEAWQMTVDGFVRVGDGAAQCNDPAATPRTDCG